MRVVVPEGGPVGAVVHVSVGLGGSRNVQVARGHAQPGHEREHDERGDRASRPAGRAEQGEGERCHTYRKV